MFSISSSENSFSNLPDPYLLENSAEQLLTEGQTAVSGVRKAAGSSIKTHGNTSKSLSPSVSFSYQRLPEVASSPSTHHGNALDGLEALKQSALKREQQLARLQMISGGKIALFRPISGYAAPLSPLRERDVTALADWFQRDDMRTIEADIAHCLLVLWPAPCWEEDPYTFLQEFLVRK